MSAFVRTVSSKYFFSFQKWGFVHWLSLFAFLGVWVGTAALIIILSVFNGLENYVGSLFSRLDPNLKIELIEGKFFQESEIPLSKINSLPGVVGASPSLEENALLRYGKFEDLARIKGITPNFLQCLPKNSNDGAPALLKEGSPWEPNAANMWLGTGLHRRLGVNPKDFTQTILLFIPRRGGINFVDPTSSYLQQRFMPTGQFEVEPELDQQLAMVPIGYLRSLVNDSMATSSIEIFTQPSANVAQLQDEIRSFLPKKFSIKNRFERQETLFQIFRLEKWVGFLILSFIILIAGMGLIGALRLLVVEKQKDISIFSALGAPKKSIQFIFVLFGVQVSGWATVLGILTGTAVVLGQQSFGWVVLSEYQQVPYPVALKWEDAGIVLGLCVGMGGLFSYFTTRKLN
jgi:lipoprotein-releasing system permease protein